MQNEKKTLKEWFSSNRTAEKFFKYLEERNLLNDEKYFHWVADRIYDEYFHNENELILKFAKNKLEEILKVKGKRRDAWLHIKGNDNYQVYVHFMFKHKIHNRQGRTENTLDFIYGVFQEYYWLSLNELTSLNFAIISYEQAFKENPNFTTSTVSSYDVRFFNKFDNYKEKSL
jgi:hypothetical protein